MALLAWLLVAFGLCAPLLTAYLVSANMRAAGYASGTGYLLSIIVIVLSIALARTSTPQRRGLRSTRGRKAPSFPMQRRKRSTRQ
jgi:hypothetical protein